MMPFVQIFSNKHLNPSLECRIHNEIKLHKVGLSFHIFLMKETIKLSTSHKNIWHLCILSYKLLKRNTKTDPKNSDGFPQCQDEFVQIAQMCSIKYFEEANAHSGKEFTDYFRLSRYAGVLNTFVLRDNKFGCRQGFPGE
ncbi:hypothetical protein ILYODFUR_029144 [Ilyodon furcidens]|uniref:Uncharacterized protein n=1 Tax=Ilyodon furcidens TaxID=33524 RepID=A0ABV0SQ46_9TELE